MNPKTKLCDLPDSEVDSSGSDLTHALRLAGYDVSPRSLINSWNCWNATVGDFLDTLAASGSARTQD